jgi:hypothetical protein
MKGREAYINIYKIEKAPKRNIYNIYHTFSVAAIVLVELICLKTLYIKAVEEV